MGKPFQYRKVSSTSPVSENKARKTLNSEELFDKVLDPGDDPDTSSVFSLSWADSCLSLMSLSDGEMFLFQIIWLYYSTLYYSTLYYSTLHYIIPHKNRNDLLELLNTVENKKKPMKIILKQYSSLKQFLKLIINRLIKTVHAYILKHNVE